MVDTGVIANVALNIVITVISILVIGGVFIGGFFYQRHLRRWKQYECRIWGKDAFGQTVEKVDRAGIFVDPKTKNKRFFLKKHKVGLDPDHVPFVAIGRKKVVYLKQTGLKNFQYITPKLTHTGVILQVGEEDVNWAVNSYEREKRRFSHDKLLQYLPFITLGFVSVVILIIFIYFFKQFDTLKDVAIAMKESARLLSSPNVIP